MYINKGNKRHSLLFTLVLLRTVVADTLQAKMLLVLCLISAVIPLTIVEGRKGGWADPTSPGDEYLYGTVIQGGPDLGIRYRFTSPFSRICCEALQCEFWRGCEFVQVGCGQSVDSIPIQTATYPWEIRDVEPAMRCYDSRGQGAYYYYTVSVVAVET